LFENQKFIDYLVAKENSPYPFHVDEIQVFIEKNKNTESEKNPASNETAVIVNEQKASSSIKVSLSKLDNLMNLVSELGTVQAEISLLSSKLRNAKLSKAVEKMQKLSRSLREDTLSIRLVPIDTLVTRFKRLIRDLSSELKKEVDFVINGADTELDKTIVDGLADPLMHIFRNSVDHGIEFPEERVKKGKTAQGKIVFDAFHEGTSVFIKIQDDGAGINLARIREIAIKRGYINEKDILTEQETLALIFSPGFTTAQNVSEVSGRGVGMDVVKRKIADLRGEIEIDTRINAGTTITLKLPLTLSSVDALLVRVGETLYLISLAVVEWCSEATQKQISSISNNLLIINGELMPIINLREEFNQSGEYPAIVRIIIVHFEGKHVALMVDEIIGDYQAVLKPLGHVECFNNIIAGASIQGDGSLALSIDTYKMIQHFHKRTLKKRQ